MLGIQRVFLVGFISLLLAQSALTSSSEAVSADERVLSAARIATDSPSLLAFFRKRTIKSDDWERMNALVRQLGERSYQIREKASVELADLGSIALPLLRQAVKDPDPEVARRAEECLRRIEDQNPSLVAAAARVVAARRPIGATEVLMGYLPFADDDLIAAEVCEALAALANPRQEYVHVAAAALANPWLGVSMGLVTEQPEKALAAALDDKMSRRRVVAAEVLLRVGDRKHLPAIRKLLHDSDILVRLRTALALAGAKEKDAIPVLINLLAELPPGQAQRAECVLVDLAQGEAPQVALGHDEASRARCRDAWLAWWRSHNSGLDLNRIEGGPLLGYTMLVLLDQGRILELDPDDKVQWQMDGLDFPLDAQALPGGRILVAEHNGHRVTERNRRGEVLWEKKVEGPLVAQRLRNGNTFIATQAQLIEVDRDGKEVFVHGSPIPGEYIMKAFKLPNGDIACITTPSITPQSRYVRIDSTGNTGPKDFPVNVKTYGGRIDVLPNGNVLVPEHANNRVVEYDRTGKVVWEASVSQPVAAVRLPNGNTLITSMNECRAVEFDRTGKNQVWEYKSDTRVTRAFRR